jgi:hypothetical protein
MTPNSSWCMSIVSAVREVSATGQRGHPEQVGKHAKNPHFGHDSGVNCLVIQTVLQEPRVLNWQKKQFTSVEDMAVTMESHSGVGMLSCNDCGHTEKVHLC